MSRIPFRTYQPVKPASLSEEDSVAWPQADFVVLDWGMEVAFPDDDAPLDERMVRIYAGDVLTFECDFAKFKEYLAKAEADPTTDSLA